MDMYDPKNRRVFHGYVHDLLEGILATCELSDAVARPITIQHCQFKIRDQNGNMFDTHPVHRSASFSGENALILSHFELLGTLSTPQGFSERFNKLNWVHDNEASAFDFGHKVNEEEHIFSFNIPQFNKIEDFGGYLSHLVAAIWEVADVFVDGRLFVPNTLRYNQDTYVIPFKAGYVDLNLGERTENTKQFRSQPLHSISGTEPTLLLVAWHWSILNAFLDFNEDRKLLSFALNNNADWVVPSKCHPSEIYEYLARICNVACKFCYLFGNPGGMAVARGKKIASKQEIETRFSYYSPEEGQALFHSQWELNEFLLDPNLESILKRIRQKSTKPFFFVTNGNPLTHKVMDILSQVKPVYLIISTNTMDAPLRSEVMGENVNNTRTALKCLEYLKMYEIPFGVSLIAFPDISFDELTRTVIALKEVNPAFVRVNMPGFTKDHPIKFEDDTDQVWMNAVKWVKEARTKVDFPIISIPSSYEFNVYDNTLNKAVITGVVQNSPAFLAGIQANDVVTRINGMPVELRSDILNIVSFLRGVAVFEIDRGGQDITIEMDLSVPGSYPYEGSVFGKYMFPYGIVVAPGLTRVSANEIQELIRENRAKRTWIITSEVMKASAVDLLERCIPESMKSIHFVLARNYFLGGNIRIMDMCTVGDFQLVIEEELRKMEAPDLVIIPGTGFNRFGRDLSGRHWSDLDRLLPFSVRILTTNSQFAF